jgi:hypothetical protein
MMMMTSLPLPLQLCFALQSRRQLPSPSCCPLSLLSLHCRLAFHCHYHCPIYLSHRCAIHRRCCRCVAVVQSIIVVTATFPVRLPLLSPLCRPLQSPLPPRHPLLPLLSLPPHWVAPFIAIAVVPSITVTPSIAVVADALLSDCPSPSITVAVSLPPHRCVAVIAAAVAVVIAATTTAHFC